MQPSKGQVGLIPGANAFIPFMICRITGSHVYHVIIVISDTLCVSAEGDGVVIKPLTDFPTAIYSRFNLTPMQADAVARFAQAQVGKPYAYISDTLIMLERIFRFRFPRWARERFSRPGEYQCAQLAEACLNAAGEDPFSERHVIGDVDPGNFEDLFIWRGWYLASYFRSFPVLPW